MTRGVRRGDWTARLGGAWHRLFLIERPSLELGCFRVAVAVTVGCHIIPSLLRLRDNYLAGAFVEYNGSFFPVWALELAARAADWVVWAFVVLFAVSWTTVLLGLWSQVSCVLMTVACYFFYARNALHIGTLSFDILLVTLSLMCATGYHGDWLSVDGLLWGDPAPHRRMRPFFIQRLLQLQITWTFWYTALSKMTAGGNWLTDHPYYYLMRYPAIGVVREFPGRAWLAQHPAWCDAIGWSVIACELSMPMLWWIRETRLLAIGLGMAFHLLLLITLHVPTIFFFLFPPQFLLFIEPERVVDWIEARRNRRAAQKLGDAVV